MKTMIILMGASGSGKSTHAKTLGLVSFSADRFFMQHGEYRFDPAQLGTAHARCFCGAIEEVRYESGSHSPKDVVIDNTNATIAEIAPYVALAQAYGYDVEFRVFDEFPYQNIHGVPEATVAAQRARLQKTLLEWPPYWPAPRMMAGE